MFVLLQLINHSRQIFNCLFLVISLTDEFTISLSDQFFSSSFQGFHLYFCYCLPTFSLVMLGCWVQWKFQVHFLDHFLGIVDFLIIMALWSIYSIFTLYNWKIFIFFLPNYLIIVIIMIIHDNYKLWNWTVISK